MFSGLAVSVWVLALAGIGIEPDTKSSADYLGESPLSLREIVIEFSLIVLTITQFAAEFSFSALVWVYLSRVVESRRKIDHGTAPEYTNNCAIESDLDRKLMAAELSLERTHEFQRAYTRCRDKHVSRVLDEFERQLALRKSRRAQADAEPISLVSTPKGTAR